ncbi:MAG: type III-B CRISPR module-associated protein Cmr5 [Methylobacter sp.]
MSRTLEQRRAAFALAFINARLADEKKDKDKLNTHIHKSPSLILQCGLGQALAFLLADAGGKANAPSKILYNALQEWLCDDTHPMRIYSQTELIDALVNGSRGDYFRAQEESLMLLNWLKKFAAAKL